MKSFYRAAIAAAVVLAFLAGGVAAQQVVGTVRVVVRGPGGATPGAKARIESSGDSRYSASAVTDAQGVSTFANVPLGEVSVRAYDGADNLLVSGKGILERAGDVITLVLEQEPAP